MRLLKEVIIGGLFIVLVAYALFAFVYPSGSKDTGQQPSEGVGNHVAATPDDSGIDTSTIPHLIFDKINDERNRVGLKAVAWNDTLARVSQVFADDMAARRFYDHVNPEGKTVNDLAIAEGYTCSTAPYYAVADNLLQDNSFHLEADAEQVADNAVEEWMSSVNHRANILTESHVESGVGIAVSTANDVAYIVQSFC